MGEVRWTREAEHWLREIHDYIAQDHPGAAQRILTGIYEKAEVLADYPKIGYRYEGHPSVRILLYGHYRIAYQIESPDRIYILGVFHGALDLERYLSF